MAKPLTNEQKKVAKKFVDGNKGNKAKTEENLKKGRGFYGHFEGLESPPKKGAKTPDLLKLLKDLKGIKPYFADKDPAMTPLVNYFYCRYMASWLINTKIAKGSLDITKHITIGAKGNSLDRFNMYCQLIENVYDGSAEADNEENAFVERLFPFDRVATIGDKPGMLQKQYGMLRSGERKKFRELASKIKIPVREQGKGVKKYGYTVAYYLMKYLEPGTALNNFTRDIPKVENKMNESVFLERGSYMVGTGYEIQKAEDKNHKLIEEWYFDGDVPDEGSKEMDAFDDEEFTIQYMPSESEDYGYSTYILEPDEDGKKVHLKLRDDRMFAQSNKGRDGKMKWTRPNANIYWVSGGDTFLPPNPKENQSFEALGNLVEAQMAHFATTASEVDKKKPNNTFEEVHFGLLGTKGKPGIAVYHANIFYHVLLAQARDPIANFNAVNEEMFSAGRLISLEAYLGKPLKIMSYWLMTLRSYVEFKGLHPETGTPRIITPKSLSLNQSIVDEQAQAEMTNSLSRLQVAYYRCMFAMLKNRQFQYPKTMSSGGKFAPREKNAELSNKELKYTDTVDLNELWSDLLHDSRIGIMNPEVMSKIVDYMYAKGKGVISFPATMDPEIGVKSDGWGTEDIGKWLKFSYAANPTSIDVFVECAAAIHSAIGMSDYLLAEDHVEGVKRFLEGVDVQGGYHYLIAILSEPGSDALPEGRVVERKEYDSYMPAGVRKNPSRKKREAEKEKEYVVHIELELPVEIDPNDGEKALKQFEIIEMKLNEEGIDDPANIGTNGKQLDMGWYVRGLDEAIDLLAEVTEIYSSMEIAGRGWLEWGQEDLRQNYTVDGYSYDDI